MKIVNYPKMNGRRYVKLEFSCTLEDAEAGAGNFKVEPGLTLQQTANEFMVNLKGIE